MKVLIVTQYFWPESFSINEIVKSLFKKGVEIEVLTGKPNYPSGIVFTGYSAWGCQRENYQGININRIPLIPRGGGGWHLVLNYLSFIVSGFIFSPWILRKKKYDVIFIYAPSPILQALPAIFLGWIKKAPVVLWVQDLWPESLSATGHVNNKAILKATKIVVRYIYSHCDLLLVQSEAFEEKVKELASDTPVMYYPNSVDPSFSTNITCSTPKVGGIDEDFPIVFAGNIGSAQAVDGASKQACFDQADVFILPTYSENFGIAVAEALANELPVITTTGAPWPDLVQFRCGWWVQPGILGISSALVEAMACESDELRQMGQRGRQLVVAKYSWDKIGITAQDVSEWVLDQTRPKPEVVDIYAR